MIHVYPPPDDPTIELDHEAELGGEYVRHLLEPRCGLCQQGRCTQRIFRHVGPDAEDMIIHALLLN